VHAIANEVSPAY